MKSAKFALVAIATLACNWSHAGHAAEITVISTVGARGLLEEIRTSFEHRTTDRLRIEYGTAAVLKRQLEGGGSFDVAILTQSMINELAQQGKVVEGSRAIVARSGMGLAARAGAAKPFIGTRAALRGALLASSGIAYTKEGQSGAAAARLFDSLGITEEMRDRIYLDTRPAGGVLAVAEGKAAMGIALLSEIAVDSKVDLVGPLPEDLQTYVVFGAGMASSTKEQEACRTFIAFLATPEVRRRLHNVGMEASQ